MPLKAPGATAQASNHPGETWTVTQAQSVRLKRERPTFARVFYRLCSHVQAVSYFFSPSTRCRPNALAPFFWVVTHHMARNHTGKGVRVS